MRIAELENVLAVPNGAVVTREMIIKQLKKDVAGIGSDDNASDEAVPRLINSYITKIYTADDEVIITGSVNIDGAVASLIRTFAA